MDWPAFALSLNLGAVTILTLLPIALMMGRWLAWSNWRWRGFVEAACALPLVLPPTVLGYYLLEGFGAASPVGALWERLTGRALVFSFEGLWLASVIANIPFAIQPAQRGFAAIAPEIREAAMVSGLSPLRSFWRVELPLAWPGVAAGMALAFAHSLGEFGVALMVGGSIPGETRTAAISVYDRVQAFDARAAAIMSLALLMLSTVALGAVHLLSARVGRHHG